MAVAGVMRWTQWLPIVSGALSILFVLLSLTRAWRLRRQTIKTGPGRLASLKFVLSLLYAALQFATLVLLVVFSAQSYAETLVPAAASSLAALSLVWVSRLEHRRSVAPSDLIVTYLLSTLLLDGVWLGAPSTWTEDRRLRLLTALQLAAKSLVFIVESQGKERVLFDQYRTLPPEVKASVLGKAFFWWINPILSEGYNNILLNHELPNIDRYISSAPLRQEILATWSDGASTRLPLVLYRSLRQHFLSVIQPRLFLILFKYSQPLLIQYSIRYVSNIYVGQSAKDEGFLIIIAAVVIYTGLALSSATYQHGINRLQTMVRGALTGLIHNKSLTVQSKAYDDGKAMALVTTDVSALESVPDMFHETWALAIEVTVGIVMLARHVGWLWFLPLVIVVVCSQISRYVAKNLRSRSMRWNVATQNRVTMTSAMIGAIKNIKMLGMQETVASHILDLRDQELEAARHLRWLMVIYNASANANGIFAPVLTIIIYALLAMSKGQSLDTETAFPTIAILSMITHPANMIMTIIPRAIASYASVERIQDYLASQDQSDQAIFTTEVVDTLQAISIQNVTVPGEKGGRKTLDGISIDIPRASFTILSGPVGAGKTILARLLLGEVAPSEGTVTVSTRRTAYCSQVPWLPARQIKDVICGPCDDESRDKTWYKTVIQACCLNEDLDALPDGDRTVVGQRGMNLSGGQRQRVALARAIYQRFEIAILDDAFSGLDGKTEDQVVTNLFAPTGLFRQLTTTVLWITNSTTHFHLADNVIILDGRVKEQGPWDELRSRNEQITKLIHHDSEDAQNLDTKSAASRSKAQATNDALVDLKRKNGDFSLYGYYFTAAGYFNVLLMISCALSYSVSSMFSQYWMKWWTEDTENRTMFYTVGYFLFNFVAWVTTSALLWSNLILLSPKSGLTLHRRLVETVTRASLYFFSTTESGSILNRFGQDIQLVDKQLPDSLLHLSVQTFKIATQLLLLFAVQPWISLTLPFVAIIVFVLQKLYLRTSRQLRIIELESKSGVYSSLLETGQGLETIRAFAWQLEMAQENSRALDASQRPAYLLYCLQRWLAIVLDLLVAAIAVGTIGLAIALRGTTTGGQIGVALVVILTTNSTLLKLVRSWTNLEVSLGAISRLRSAERDIPKEDQPTEDLILATDWPSVGGVEFKDVTAAYNENAVAFRNLSLQILPGQTVVICGRTGSGKSSVLLSLLRLIDINSGSILVDGVDISSVPRSDIRRRCFVAVAQDPFILPEASLRFNLDPSGAVTDEWLLDVLERVGLKSHFGAGTGSDDGEEAAHFLEEPLSKLPTLSGGQMQLLAVARAVLQTEALSSPHASAQSGYTDTVSKPIILLDEITSSLDTATEAAVYKIIQESFIDKGHTVVMVTHKLGSFVQRMRPGKDVVAWMKDGQLERLDDAKDIDIPSGV